MNTLLGAVLVVAAAATPAAADVAFSSMFHGNMAVLQRGVPVNVYGKGPPNTHVILKTPASALPATVATDADGQWEYMMAAQPTAWNKSMTVTHTTSGSTDTVTVSFGETLVCSGQSNMQMPVYNGNACCKLPPSQRKGFCSCFAADNGTVEVTAAGQYAGKIALASIEQNWKGWNGTYCPYPWTNPSCISQPEWNTIVGGVDGNVGHFSALCWYTGVSMFEQLGGNVPVGLITGSVGGSPIEFWLPPGHVNNSICGVDNPPCDNGGKNNYTDSEFFQQLIFPYMPYTVGTVLWDQGERDVHCLPQTNGGVFPENETSRYACMEQELVKSWRKGFKSDFGFVAVQLPGYLGDCGTYDECMSELPAMRLQQQVGLEGFSSTSGAMTTLTPTYDLGCPFGVKTDACPYGSVHNVNKRPVGARVASQIIAGGKGRYKGNQEGPAGRGREGGEGGSAHQFPGPALLSVHASATGSVGATSTVTVTFDGPVAQKPTANCAACCTQGNVGDFDASFDHGKTWVNGTRPGNAQSYADGVVRFQVVAAAAASITHVRYVFNQAFPQCAIYSASAATTAAAGAGAAVTSASLFGSIPAMPFSVQVNQNGAWKTGM